MLVESSSWGSPVIGRGLAVCGDEAAAELIGFGSLMSDLGWRLKAVPEVCMDSSAARGIAGRKGLVKTQHMEVRRMWMQDALADKRTETNKISGSLNPADVLTKLKSFREVSSLVLPVGITVL